MNNNLSSEIDTVSDTLSLTVVRETAKSIISLVDELENEASCNIADAKDDVVDNPYKSNLRKTDDILGPDQHPRIFNARRNSVIFMLNSLENIITNNNDMDNSTEITNDSENINKRVTPLLPYYKLIFKILYVFYIFGINICFVVR